MMFSVLILATVSLCGGALVPQIDGKEELHKDSGNLPSPGVNQLGNQPQSYPQGNSLSSQYYYPTYPDYSGNGYTPQSGYDGYLVPAIPTGQKNNWVSDMATTLFPGSNQLIFYGSRALVFAFHLLMMISLGGLFTLLICSFTPLCSISFPGFDFQKDQVKEQVAELARTYITPESVNAATILVSKAINKYTAMQQETREKEQPRANPIRPARKR